MKVILIGGHLSPAISVIEKLNKNEIFYIGRKYTFEGDSAVSLEYQEITKMNIPFFPIKTARFQRKFTRYTIISFLKFPLGFFQSIKILRKIKPDVVLGFGGYVSVPVILAANLLKIPIVIHEQTLEAGFANKIVSSLVKKICISFESSREFFPKEKIVFTGNPIKKEILNIKVNKKKNVIPVIYITGGSSGSHAINILVKNSLEKLLKNYIVFHQTGDSQKFKDYKNLEIERNMLNKEISRNYNISKFLSSRDVARILNNADLVIGRSGINIVTELIYLQKPAFLIPLPFSQNNEQFKNAEFLKSLGLAEIIKQDLLTDSLFLSKINSMIKNLDNYKLSKSFVLENASDKIVEVLKNVAKEKTA